jgi:hypothetical protein
MRHGAGYDHDPRHFRFARQITETPVVEVYEPAAEKLRWVIGVTIGALSVIAIAVFA